MTATARTERPPKRPAVSHLLVIGGGAAAFAAATRAADSDVKVTMVNAGLPVGGTCVNVGCMPSKMLLDAVRSYRRAAKPDAPWLTVEKVRLDFRRLMEAKTEMVLSARHQNYNDVIEALGNVRLVEGRARFVGPHEVEVNGDRFRGDAVLIATGGRTLVPDVPGLREADPLTNITALDLDEPPESLAVVGGGPLGLEWAQIFARVGVRVELFGRILPRHEPEVSDSIAKHLQEDDGISLHVGHRVTRVESRSGALRVVDDHGDAVEVERILVATGIRPNTEDLGLDLAGVQTDPRGFVVVDERGETSTPGVYAAGDVTGLRELEPVAAKQGFLAAHNAITGETRTFDLQGVPEAVFTDPQVAKVGWTEAEMMESLGTCDCRTVPMEWIPKAHAVGDKRGLAKLVVHPETRRILGASVVGVNAAEVIHIPTLAMRAGWTIDDLIDTVHVFPTYSEVWKFAAQSFERDPETMSCCIV